MNWKAEIIDNFTQYEASCHGWEDQTWHSCGLIIIVPELCECLSSVRVEYNKPIKVKSWTRCKLHNTAVGGKDDSYHQNGHAVDIAPVDMDDLDEVERIGRKYFVFVEPYSWGLHCDIRGKRPEMIYA